MDGYVFTGVCLSGGGGVVPLVTGPFLGEGYPLVSGSRSFPGGQGRCYPSQVIGQATSSHDQDIPKKGHGYGAGSMPLAQDFLVTPTFCMKVYFSLKLNFWLNGSQPIKIFIDSSRGTVLLAFFYRE